MDGLRSTSEAGPGPRRFLSATGRQPGDQTILFAVSIEGRRPASGRRWRWQDDGVDEVGLGGGAVMRLADPPWTDAGATIPRLHRMTSRE
jgi:hypothetical protein